MQRRLLGLLWLPGITAAVIGAVPAYAQPPTVVFVENFEHNVGPTQTLPLGAYVGAPPVTPKYTAAPYWLDGAQCNGHIVPSDVVAAIPGCGRGSELQAMAAALGMVGNTPHNHAVAAHTDKSSVHPGVDKVEFQTTNPVDPITLTAVNRFIAFSVDVAVSNCQSNHPKLKFALLDGGTEVPAFSSPVDPCVTNTPPVQSGRFFSDLAVLNTSLTLGVVMRNGQGNSNGNDHAFDNITIFDATPTLSKAFEPAQVPVGAMSQLTFTITNTSELAAKPGWSLTDTFPSGLAVAHPAGGATTCTKGVVTATPGATSVSATGRLDAGQASCTVTVSVTSKAARTYKNGPDNLTAVGLDKPGPSSVVFTGGAPTATTTSTSVVARPRLPRSGGSPTGTAAAGALALAFGALLLVWSAPAEPGDAHRGRRNRPPT